VQLGVDQSWGVRRGTAFIGLCYVKKIAFGVHRVQLRHLPYDMDKVMFG
jgi:hypothetical protein